MSNIGELNRWAKGKPKNLVMMAEQLATGAEACSEALELIREGGRIEDLVPLVKTNEWVQLYRNHRKVLRNVAEELRRFEGMGELLAGVVEFFLSRGREKKELDRNLEKIWKMRPDKRVKLLREIGNEMYSLHLADIESDLESELDAKLEKKLRGALKRPEIFFYLRIWIPCWFLYKDLPGRMLRRARFGDVETMEKLLRLDIRVLEDSKIRDYLQEAKRKSRKATLGRLTNAIREEVKGKTTVKKVKSILAGLISAISEVQGERLSGAKISDLFHALACDLGREDGDADIPEDSDTFAKAILRERALWKPIIRPDKK